MTKHSTEHGVTFLLISKVSKIRKACERVTYYEGLYEDGIYNLLETE